MELVTKYPNQVVNELFGGGWGAYSEAGGVI